MLVVNNEVTLLARTLQNVPGRPCRTRRARKNPGGFIAFLLKFERLQGFAPVRIEQPVEFFLAP